MERMQNLSGEDLLKLIEIHAKSWWAHERKRPPEPLLTSPLSWRAC